MKRIILFLSICMVGFCYLTLDKTLSELGLIRDGAIAYIDSSFTAGTLIYPAAASKIASKARAAIATDMVRLAKEWTESPEFVQWYSNFRRNGKPPAPEPPHGAGEINSERLLAIKQLEETAKNINLLPADQQPAMKRMIDSTRAAMMTEQMQMRPEQMIEQDRIANEAFNIKIQSYNKQLSDWDKTFPPDPVDAIKARLQAYLALSDSVDFTAALTDLTNGKRLFVNPEYEKKSWTWKKCYRAGKEANAAARQAVWAWLKGLK
jgi:hypothetical protein